MQNQIEFGYWRIRGIAQPLNFLLEFLQIPYVEKRWEYGDAEWYNSVQQPPLNNEVLANLPYVKDGDKWVFESQAIYIYLVYKANRPELLGTTGEEQVLVEQVKGVLIDLYKAFRSLIAIPKEQYEEKKEAYFNQEVLWIVEKLNKFIEGKTWAIGDQITYVDFFQFELEETLEAYKPGTLDANPNLKKHHQQFSEIPQIKAYLSSERFISKPFYPKGRWRWE